jgi:EAL domain-containing protein (putative c-di-GMP-specific phosphodiesterase class I)
MNSIYKKIVSEQIVKHVYQPMWNLHNWHVFGYEALLRFSDENLKDIEYVFEQVREEGDLYNLDTLSIYYAIKSMPISMLGDALLFINVYPSTVLHGQFDSFIYNLIQEFPEYKGKMVLELNETSKEEGIWDTPALKEKVNHLRRSGIRIALDDIGKGVANLQKIIEFSPDFIKLDRYFAKDLAISLEKKSAIEFFIHHCGQQIGLILEGIEKDIDLAEAKYINVPYAQGYLLGRPKAISAHHNNSRSIGVLPSVFIKKQQDLRKQSINNN